MTADGKTPLTLPGPPVSASVSWDDVRRYLRAEGWEHQPMRHDWEHWDRGTRAIQFGASGVGMARVIGEIAAYEGVSPGEMLARIAGQPRTVGAFAEAAWAAGAEDMRERCAKMAEEREDVLLTRRIRALPIESGKAEP